MTRISEFDDQQLLELTRRTDPLGVVSVYVTVEPGDHAAAGIDLRNRYRELQRRIEASGTERREDVLAALERLLPEIDRVADPTASGRGRIAFAGLGDRSVLRLDTQMAVPNRVVLDDGPFVHPLLELLDEGQPAGIVLLSSEEGVLLEWRLGELEQLDRVSRELSEAAHERAGQIGGGPPGQFHTPMTEHRQAREQDQMLRFARRLAQTVVDIAGERGWRRLLVSGEERWTALLVDSLPQPLQDAAIREARVLSGLDQQGLTNAVTDRLHDEHLTRERRLVEQIRGAGAEGTAALGLSEVAAALNEGRVSHLIYDPGIRYSGSVGDGGVLHAGTETGVDGAAGAPEPRLTERLVERALASGARVSPVEGASHGALNEAEGIAALLRW